MSSSASAADSSATAPPSKRMRLGTKSCAECRRRKVRCVLSPGEDICEQCAVHGVTCRPQNGTRDRQSAAAAGSTSPAPTGSDRSDNEFLHKRLAHLESVLGRMIDAQDRNNEVLPASSAQMRVRQRSFAGNEELEGPSQGNGDASLETAPFSHVWKDVITIQSISTPDNTNEGQQSSSLVQLNSPPLPNVEVLAQIFSHTERLWPIWSSCTFDTTGAKRLQAGNPQRNAETIMAAILPQDSIITPKAYLFLILSLSHITHTHSLLLDLPLPRPALILQYQAHAQILLDSSPETPLNSHTLVCIFLQYRIALDSGKPLAAWRLLRSAITLAIELGYHHSSADYNDDIEKATWTGLWQNERQLSCMLGLPSCTTNLHVGCRPSDLNMQTASTLEIVHHKLSIIAGDIIDRDQNRIGTAKAEDYSATIRIDQDLDAVIANLPSSMLEPLSPTLASEVSFAELYFHIWTAMRVHMTQKLLHMPYMLRWSKTTSATVAEAGANQYYHQHSFMRTVEASRKMITMYSSFRNASTEFLCEVMDFQAFSAAMALLIAILVSRKSDHGTARAGSTTYSYYNEEEEGDWMLITTTSRYLRQTATVLDCQVAKQGADTLDMLTAACRGSGPDTRAPESMLVSIPYFGRAKISLPKASESERGIAGYEHSSSSFDPSILPLATGYAQPSQYPPNTMACLEICCDESNAAPSPSFSFGDELRRNWFHDFDALEPMADFKNFDWVQEFWIPDPEYAATTTLQ